MIKKQSLWFLTLFSLILVLSIYYITMPDEMFITNNKNTITDEIPVISEVDSKDIVTTLKLELEDERQELMTSLEKTLNSTEATTEDKNDAYEQIKYLNTLKGIEENIENKITKEFEVKAFVKVDNTDVSVVVAEKKHDIALANKIMRSVQKEFTTPVSVSIKFNI